MLPVKITLNWVLKHDHSCWVLLCLWEIDANAPGSVFYKAQSLSAVSAAIWKQITEKYTQQ